MEPTGNVGPPLTSGANAEDSEAASIERFNRNPGTWLLNEGGVLASRTATCAHRLRTSSQKYRADGLCRACMVPFAAAWLQRSVTSYHSLVTDAREKRLSPGARRALKEHPPEYYFLILARELSSVLESAAIIVWSAMAPANWKVDIHGGVDAHAPSASVRILKRQLAEPELLRAFAAAARLVREAVWPALRASGAAEPAAGSAAASSTAPKASVPAMRPAKDAVEMREGAWWVLVAAANVVYVAAQHGLKSDGSADTATSGDSSSGRAGGGDGRGRASARSGDAGVGSGVGDQEKCRTLVELCGVVEAVAGAVLEAPPCAAAEAAPNADGVLSNEDSTPIALLQLVPVVASANCSPGSLQHALALRLLSGPELTRLRWAALRRLGELVPPAALGPVTAGAGDLPARQQHREALAGANGPVVSRSGGGGCSYPDATGADGATAGGGEACGSITCGDGTGSMGRSMGNVSVAPEEANAALELELPAHVLRFLERGSGLKESLYSMVFRAMTLPGLRGGPLGRRRHPAPSGLEAHPRRFARLAAAACRAVCLEAEAAAEAARAAAGGAKRDDKDIMLLLANLPALISAHMEPSDAPPPSAVAAAQVPTAAAAQFPTAAAAQFPTAAAAQVPTAAAGQAPTSAERPAVSDVLECYAWTLRAMAAVNGGRSCADGAKDVAHYFVLAIQPGSEFSGWSPAQKAACARRLLPAGLMRSLDCLLRRSVDAAMPAAPGATEPATGRDEERHLAASKVLKGRLYVFGDVLWRMLGPILSARIAVAAEVTDAAKAEAADLLPAPPTPPQAEQPNAMAAAPEVGPAASDGPHVARRARPPRRDDGSWLQEEVGVSVTLCKLARWRAAELAAGGSRARQPPQVGAMPTEMWLCDFSLAVALVGALSTIPQLLSDIGMPPQQQQQQQQSPACLRPPQRADSAAAAADAADGAAGYAKTAAVTVLTDVAVLAARALLPLLSQLLPLFTEMLHNTPNEPVKACAVDLLRMAAPAAAAAVRSLPAHEALAAAPERLLAGLYLLLQELERVCRGMHGAADNMERPAGQVTLSFMFMLADERLAGPLAARLWGGGQAAAAAAGATMKARQQAQGEQTGGAGLAQQQDPSTQPGALPSHSPLEEQQQRELREKSAAATPEGPLIDADSMQRLLQRCNPAFARMLERIRQTVLAGKAAILPKSDHTAFRGLSQQWREWAGLLDGEDAPPWLPRLLRLCGNPGCRSFDCAAEAGLQLKQCAGCRVVRYCGAACQRQHWRGGHNVECKRLCAGTQGTETKPGT